MAALLPGSDCSLPALDTLREALGVAGAVRVQINVDDESVAQATLRLRTHEEPIRALVSVWTPNATAAALVLAPVADVWLVEERRPIEPPTAPDGAPEPWLANMALLRRPAQMPHEDWKSYWLEQHTQIAIDTQDTHGYVQNLVLDTLTAHEGRDAHLVAAIVEELFHPQAMTDPHVFYGSGGDDAELRRRMTLMYESVEKFGASRDLSLVPTTRRVYTQA